MILLSEYQELTEKGIDLNFNPIKRSLAGTSFRWNESTKLEYSNFKSNDKEWLIDPPLLYLIDISKVQICFAGKISEIMLFNDIKKNNDKSGDSDVKTALEKLTRWKFKIPNVYKNILLYQTKKIIAIIVENYKIIHLIAIVSLVKRKNNKKEIEYVYKHKRLPEIMQKKVNENQGLKALFYRKFNDKDIFLKYKNFIFEDFFPHEIISNSKLFEFLTNVQQVPKIEKKAFDFNTLQEQVEEFYEYKPLEAANILQEKFDFDTLQKQAMSLSF